MSRASGPLPGLRARCSGPLPPPAERWRLMSWAYSPSVSAAPPPWPAAKAAMSRASGPWTGSRSNVWNHRRMRCFGLSALRFLLRRHLGLRPRLLCLGPPALGRSGFGAGCGGSHCPGRACPPEHCTRGTERTGSLKAFGHWRVTPSVEGYLRRFARADRQPEGRRPET
jgi:hypothetical protein